LIDQKNRDSRVSTYINKRISIESWSEASHSLDVQSIRIHLNDVQINVHNIYSPPPTSHTDNNTLNSLVVLAQALRIPGEHVVIGDFNLHHPLWGGPTYPHQHSVAESLIQTMRDADIKLALPQGTITREAMRGRTIEQTTIDLVWLSASLLPRMAQCRVARELE
jgi:Endonuclease-reverse transcriptase